MLMYYLQRCIFQQERTVYRALRNEFKNILPLIITLFIIFGIIIQSCYLMDHNLKITSKFSEAALHRCSYKKLL